jgi:serine/threonine protein phosphatase PrpC
VQICPTCGAPSGNDELFCEADGTRLPRSLLPTGEITEDVTEEETLSQVARINTALRASGASQPGACGACGAAHEGDGDGYCKVCGHRIEVETEAPSSRFDPADEPPATSLRVGLAVGKYTVLGPAARDDARATTPDGREVLLILGSPSALAVEAEALQKLQGMRGFPRLLERGQTPPLAWAALSAPPASLRKLGDVVQNGTPAEAVAAIEGLLDLIEAAESVGYSFYPAPRDLLLQADGKVAVARVRGAARRRPIDARRLLESLGDVFLAPALLGPTRLVRLLVPNRDAEDASDRSIADVRRLLDAVKAELSIPLGNDTTAELCDPGLWRPYNQDATALARGVSFAGDPFTVMVVCDGVSSSPHSEVASSTAAREARDVLDQFLRSPDVVHETAASAVSRAIRAAHLATCAAHAAAPVPDLPGTTIVVGLVYKKRLTVGWVGDSRIYWLTPRSVELLTHDHSWVNEAIARGEVKDASEVQGSLAHTITRCLGPLEVGDSPAEVESEVKSRDLTGPGVVLLCSDGLWNYTPAPEDLGRVLRAIPDDRNAIAVARLFVNYALARGGQDNVSVAIHAFTP